MTFKIIILSARAGNLVPCVRSILKNEPNLPPEHIIVVDDGARPEAEDQLPGMTWLPGQKPFVFARNANLGIGQADSDVILFNDDARLTTPQGFTRLVRQARRRPEVGICSAGIRGLIGNPRQKALPGQTMRFEPKMLAFVCVYLPQTIYRQVGPLDERFTGYGFEDNDYCDRIIAAGYRLAIWDGCVVEHGGELPSTFRDQGNIQTLFRQNQRLYQAKQHQTQNPVNDEAGVDLLYLAWNRLEFTKETFTTMVANTEWRYVRELFVFDDGSQDGTRAWLEAHLDRVPAPTRFLKTDFQSPVTALVHFVKLAAAPLLAKTDNDTMLPPGWLSQSLAVMRRHPELSMLGLEAMYPVASDPDIPRSYTPAPFVSGLGLYRRSIFARSRPRAIKRYFGLEEWQQAHRRRIKAGWITPALPVFLLDRLPYEPWRRYSAGYVHRGWQRDWPDYDAADTLWHWRWPDYTPDNGCAKRAAIQKLNIAHLADPCPGYTNVSLLTGLDMDHVDLQRPWPWADNTFGSVRAAEVIEHLPDKILTMNELWRVVRPGGTVEITVPTTEGPGAWQDPTHVSFWNRRSFLYFEAGNPYRERFAQNYGIQARFRVIRDLVEQTGDGPRLTIILEAVKP